MIQLVEYQRSAVALRKGDRDYLLGLVRGATGAERGVLERLTPTREDDVYELTPGPFVGRLGLPSGESIDIESRFPFEDVLALISLSGRGPSFLRRFAADMVGAPFLVDLITEAFLREVEHIVGRGIGKGYVTRRFVDPPYPGKLDITYHLSRLYAREDRLASTARRLTVDIEINRALAMALDVLGRASHGNTSAIARIARLASVLRSVTRSPITATAVRTFTVTRLHSYYGDALSLAALILEGNALAPEGTGAPGASILFHMPKVWEDCVVRWAQEQWGPDYRVEGQHAFDLSSRGELTSVADVVVWDDQRPVALYDAKYKLPRSTPDVSDVYQMVSYCERLGLDEATLVYPVATESKRFEVGRRVVNVIGLPQTLLHERVGARI